MDAPPRDILVIKPSSLGDVVHTLPAVALVKRHWPEARLRWLVNPEWAPLLAENPHVDEVVIFPRAEFRGIGGLLKVPAWARKIGAGKAELVLDFQGLLRSALIARQCRAQGGEIVGLTDAREGARFFYDRVVNVSGCTHAVDRYLALVAALGIPAPASTALEWPLPAGTLLPDVVLPERFVVLHPFARGGGKSLEDEEVAAFCAGVAPLPVVIAGRAERSAPCAPHAIDLLNRTTLEQLIFLLRRAAFVVSVDSGPMHIAASITANLVSIHTWSDPRKVGPYRRDAWILHEGKISRPAGLDLSEEPATIANMAELGSWVRSRL